MKKGKYYYVYKITDLKKEKYYIGHRGSELPPEEDLGHVYFSSSCNKMFKEEQIKNPERFEYEIIKTHPGRGQAYKHEQELLRQNNAYSGDDYYNGRIRAKALSVRKSVSSRATKDTMSYLGRLIKLARVEHSMMAQELADRVGISRGLLQRIESGNLRVTMAPVIETCFVLGIPVLGCDKKHINSLSMMLSYMNKLFPGSIRHSSKNAVQDDF